MKSKARKTRLHLMARHHKSPRSRRNLMVLDLLTLPQGHQFDPSVIFSMYPGLLLIPFNLICHMTMFRKFNFWTLQSHPPLEHDPWDWMKNSCLICLISFNCQETHKVWFKNLWNRLCNWNLMIFAFMVPPQDPRGRGQKIVPLHVTFM